MDANEVLKFAIKLLLLDLEEVKSASADDADQFAYGEKNAYIECLELLQKWEKAKEFGLDFDIEEKYPL